MSSETFAASIERTPYQEIQKLHLKINDNPLFNNFLDMVPLEVLIVDTNRQIVYINQALKSKLSSQQTGDIFGKRPGEFLGCVRATMNEHGCGTATACNYCGALQAMLESQSGNLTVVRNAFIRVNEEDGEKQLDFRITAKPFLYEQIQLTILFFEDITAQTRLNILHRMFFHDLINSAGALISISHEIKEEQKYDPSLTNLLCTASDALYDEIISQKLLFQAEDKQLIVSVKKVDLREELQNVSEIMKPRFKEDNRVLILKDSGTLYCSTDPVILKRVIINLLKNGLESSLNAGSIVEVWYGKNDNGVFFSVKNDMVMSEAVKSQLFFRTFSTKGNGRGIGTYSIKLLTEQYLNGKVSFISDVKNGTVFTISLPV
ncbi:MAG: HAMP domain-containing histidine kinase [Fibrobacter sp.]|nr:HAMP domain-containing histidine kinase [Fibrobacter sp.]